ncbi:MAG TPA: DUF5916 domain-containing protein [Longimicrobium sp.]|nr:DUF5916 domain-containing protein [Longimicrobium sp.]
MTHTTISRTVPAALLALAASALSLRAQAPAPVREGPLPLEAPRVVRAAPASAMRIDGRLDEAAWAQAGLATDFVQRTPTPGAAASERTEVRVLYDAGAIYVGARMFDPHPDSLAAPLARRDEPLPNSEWFNVVLDSYHDRRTAFRFGVNPAGLRRDVYHSNDGQGEDAGWDAVWEVATTIDSAGWTAEFRIPLSQLRFNARADGGEQTWGATFFRYIARRDEWSHWAPWLPEHAGFVSRFGELQGLRGLRAPRRLELLPYTSARLDRRPAPGSPGDPFYHANDVGGAVGLDVKLGVTSGLTLTGTVNPDFGQVELDPAVVNLTAFETQFAERRPFFVEGADIFRFGQPVAYNRYGAPEFFYSRRIGRAPQVPLGSGDAGWVDQPEQSTILAAAKLSGQVGGGWSVGVMDALTQREDGRWETTGGERGTYPVEPLSNYFVGRVRRDLNGGASTVGALLTSTYRDLAHPGLEGVLRGNAAVGGIDFEHSWARRLWTVSGYVAGSRVGGSEGALLRTQTSSGRYFQRPDAEHLELDPERTSLGGHAAALALNRSGDWDMSVELRDVSPGFELNDLGFARRADFRSIATFLGHRHNRPTKHVRQWTAATWTTLAWNQGGDRISTELGGSAFVMLPNLWHGGVELGVSPEVKDDRLTWGGPLAARPASWSGGAWFNSDQRRSLSFGGGWFMGGDRNGGWSRSGNFSVALRPSPSLQVRVGPSLSRVRDAAQYLATVEDEDAAETFGARYLFARLDQTTFSLDTRVDWTFTPTLSLQVFAQPFVAAGSYGEFKEFRTPGRAEYDVYGRDRGTVCTVEGGYVIHPVQQVDCAEAAGGIDVPRPDFTVRSLRGNAVVRWEYRPGSTLFFVWQQERAGAGASGVFHADDVGRLFREPARNVFLVKATYWIG